MWRGAGPGGIPDRLRSWITDRRSLTRRLRGACPGGFRVHLLAQIRALPLDIEARLLGLGTRRRVLVREVLLMCDERPWVYGRTVIPSETLRGRGRRLAHLGTRPLGGVLFARRDARREAVEVLRVGPGHPLHEAAARALGHPQPSGWLRRSRFRLGDTGRLLVSELFLDGFR